MDHHTTADISELQSEETPWSNSRVITRSAAWRSDESNFSITDSKPKPPDALTRFSSAKRAACSRDCSILRLESDLPTGRHGETITHRITENVTRGR